MKNILFFVFLVSLLLSYSALFADCEFYENIAMEWDELSAQDNTVLAKRWKTRFTFYGKKPIMIPFG